MEEKEKGEEKVVEGREGRKGRRRIRRRRRSKRRRWRVEKKGGEEDFD